MSNLPTEQRASCPSWCTWEHRESDHPSDRTHWTDDVEVDVTLVDADPIEVVLGQDGEEPPPRVDLITPRSAQGTPLTLAQARRLGELLVAAADLGGDCGTVRQDVFTAAELGAIRDALEETEVLHRQRAEHAESIGRPDRAGRWRERVAPIEALWSKLDRVGGAS